MCALVLEIPHIAKPKIVAKTTELPEASCYCHLPLPTVNYLQDPPPRLRV